MSKKKTGFGFNPEGSTFVFGNVKQGVGKIFIEGHSQFARNDYSAMLNRFGSVNKIRNSDIQIGIQRIFGEGPLHSRKKPAHA